MSNNLNAQDLADLSGLQQIGKAIRFAPEVEVKGGKVNYYLIHVAHPQREDQAPYTAECEDVGEALGLTPDEMNIFKEIWRSAAARKHNGKPGHTALYGAQKIYHYAGRILKQQMIAAGTWTKGFLKTL